MKSLKTHQFPLQIDEFAYNLQVTITTESEIKAKIVLLDPNGNVQDPMVHLSHSIIYRIPKPMMGTWMLLVPVETGKFDYVARVKSSNVIEFGYYYILDYNGVSSPVAHPIKGENTQVLLQGETLPCLCLLLFNTEMFVYIGSELCVMITGFICKYILYVGSLGSYLILNTNTNTK